MITFYKHSGIYTLETEQVLHISLEKAWDFFSSPHNLEKITPSNMGFKITSPLGEKAYQGQIITYKVGIIPFINTNWVTEITQVKDKHFFVDEQRFGPYKMWHHEHFFEQIDNHKINMKDKISYKIPFGILGELAQFLFIKKQLTTIFTYRFNQLEKLFHDK